MSSVSSSNSKHNSKRNNNSNNKLSAMTTEMVEEGPLIGATIHADNKVKVSRTIIMRITSSTKEETNNKIKVKIKVRGGMTLSNSSSSIIKGREKTRFLIGTGTEEEIVGTEIEEGIAETDSGHKNITRPTGITITITTMVTTITIIIVVAVTISITEGIEGLLIEGGAGQVGVTNR